MAKRRSVESELENLMNGGDNSTISLPNPKRPAPYLSGTAKDDVLKRHHLSTRSLPLTVVRPFPGPGYAYENNIEPRSVMAAIVEEPEKYYVEPIHWGPDHLKLLNVHFNRSIFSTDKPCAKAAALKKTPLQMLIGNFSRLDGTKRRVQKMVKVLDYYGFQKIRGKSVPYFRFNDDRVITPVKVDGLFSWKSPDVNYHRLGRAAPFAPLVYIELENVRLHHFDNLFQNQYYRDHAEEQLSRLLIDDPEDPYIAALLITMAQAAHAHELHIMEPRRTEKAPFGRSFPHEVHAIALSTDATSLHFYTTDVSLGLLNKVSCPSLYYPSAPVEISYITVDLSEENLGILDRLLSAVGADSM